MDVRHHNTMRKEIFLIYLITLFVATSCSNDESVEADFLEVTTLPITDISSDGATYNAEITSNGSIEISSYGFV